MQLMSRTSAVAAIVGALFCACTSPSTVGLDASHADVGQVDAGSIDAGTPDAGDVDAGVVDAGPIDAGETDAGAVDAGPQDSGPVDAGPIDAGPVDAGVTCTDGGSTNACMTTADCQCPFVCAFDHTQSITSGICTLPCHTTADCPLLFTSFQNGACTTDVCAPDGGWYSACNAAGTGDGTCIPERDTQGHLYGACFQAGAAVTTCDGSARRDRGGPLCEVGAACVAAGGTECQELCDPTLDGGTACPSGTVCKAVGGFTVPELGTCDPLGEGGCAEQALGTELSSCSQNSDCKCPDHCVLDPGTGSSICTLPCSTTADCATAYTTCLGGSCLPDYCVSNGRNQSAPGAGYGLPCDVQGIGDGTCMPVPGANTYGLCIQGGTALSGAQCSTYMIDLPPRDMPNILCPVGEFCALSFITFHATCSMPCDSTIVGSCGAGQGCFSQLPGRTMPGELVGACGACAPATTSCQGNAECCSGVCDPGSRACQ
jgi:hypothetical protein